MFTKVGCVRFCGVGSKVLYRGLGNTVILFINVIHQTTTFDLFCFV